MKKRNMLISFLFLNLGMLVAASPTILMFSKLSIPPGGMTSVAMILSQLFGFATSNKGIAIFGILLGFPLILLGYRVFGASYALKVSYVSFSYPFFVGFFEPILKHFIGEINLNIVLTIILGGFLQGLGVAIAMQTGANTGGTDILAQVLNKYVPKISMGASIAIFNYIIMGLSLLFLGASNTAYGVAVIFVTSFTVDFALKFFRSFSKK